MVDIKKNLEKVAPAPKPEIKPKPCLTLEMRVVELEGDLKRIVEVLAKMGGEPYSSLLKKIVSKRQGA